MPVEPFEKHRDAGLALLRRHQETSLFLLGNRHDYGPVLTAHLNSGNFKVLLQNDEVAAVFVLTRRGNLLMQTDHRGEYADAILDACAEEPIRLEGVLGDWRLIAPLWERFLERNPAVATSYRSREPLFRLSLATAISAPELPVRLLVDDDFAAQDALRLAFDAEEGLPSQGSEVQRRVAFLEKVRAGRWWGHFEGDRLVAMACLNTGVGDVGQVGGVYTVPERRRRGYSKAVMRQLIADSRERQGLKTLILFTGETNHEAQAMYRGLGFEQIGEFGMIFGKPDAPS